MMRVVVVGAGYAGLTCALRFARKARGRAHVTLINGSERFVERIRLHEQAAGKAQPVLELGELVRGTGVQLQLGWVSQIDLEANTLVVGDRSVSWDQLVLAAGSEFADAQVPGAREHAFTLEPRSLPWLEAALPAIAKRNGRVVVVGGGLTGIEAAAEFAEAQPALRVTLVTRGEVAPDCTPAARAHVRQTLTKLGVELREQVAVQSVHAHHVQTAQGELPFSACVWAVGFCASPLARAAGLAVNAIGQAIVDDQLRARANVHIVGDLAAFAPMPMGCKSAFPTGMCVADNLARMLEGEPPQDFRYLRVPYCVSLGRHDALLQMPIREGKMPRHLRGKLAARIKELICRGTVWTLRTEALWARVSHALSARAQPLLADPDHV
jgi:NADH dehydrogenase FAD-containing subunit